MERLKDFNLHKWTKEDLIDLLEDYPKLFEMSAEELQKLIRDKYSDAQYHIECATRLENDASAIERYYKAKYN